MLPADIGPHPDAPNHYTLFGKPDGWADEDCGTLGVRRVGATGDMLYEPAARIVRDDLPSGGIVYPCFMTEWTLTDDERERVAALIAAGEPVKIRHLMVANSLPPQSAWVTGETEV